MADSTSPDLSQLRRWCELANMAAYVVCCRQRNSCILTSHALAAFLRARDLDAEVFRAEVHAHFPARNAFGFSLGSSGDGSRRPAAGPGMWHGHLAVICEGYVLDPTIDQAESDGVRIQPCAFPVPDGWDEGRSRRWKESGLQVSYRKYYRQVGWKSAGDARPSRWRLVSDLMEDVLAGAAA